MRGHRYRRRRVAPAYSQYCVLTAVGLPCVHGPDKPHEACEIMGPTIPVSIEQARYYAAGQIDIGYPELREQVARYIVATGHCVWHACVEIQGSPTCSCAGCRPEDPRYPWLLDSRRIAREARP